MNVYDCQDTPFFDECDEDAWGELQRGLVDRNYPGPCMMQCAPPAARARASAEQAEREQAARRADTSREDWYKAREYDRQCRAAQNQRRAWMDSYDPMVTAQNFGYSTGPRMAPTVSTTYGAGSKADAEESPKKEGMSGDPSLTQLLNSNLGMVLLVIIVVLLYALYDQSRQIQALRAMVSLVTPTTPQTVAPVIPV